MRLTFLASLLATTLPAALLATLAGPADAAPVPQVSYAQWDTKAQFGSGTLKDVRVAKGKLILDAPRGSREYVDPHTGRARTYDFGQWKSAWTRPGFGLTELIPSWAASTPGDTFVQVQIRGKGSGATSSWDTIARWAGDDATVRRTSPPSGAESDDLAWVNTDTWVSQSVAGLTSWQVRVVLHRAAGTNATPAVDSVGAMASRLPEASTVSTSKPGVARGITLDVPRYSQMTHRGEYPQYGNGGEAWCSPTSTSMLLGYYDKLPTAKQYAWVNQSDSDRFVDHAARMTYDYEYDGTGNWAFNTAYAANYTKTSFVTRLRSLAEAERFIKAGIPLAASIAFGKGELTGAPISSTNGHLVVIVGFDKAGDVIVNDPAAATNSGVRRTYDRGQFENAWVPKSGGTVYVISDKAHPLPARQSNTNW